MGLLNICTGSVTSYKFVHVCFCFCYKCSCLFFFFMLCFIEEYYKVIILVPLLLSGIVLYMKYGIYFSSGGRGEAVTLHKCIELDDKMKK